MTLETVPMSTRVTHQFRERVLASGRRANDPDQSATLRRLIELGLEAEEQAIMWEGRIPSPRRSAIRGTGRRTARHEVLALAIAAGDHGITADEAAAALPGRPENTVARRFTDLCQARLIAPLGRPSDPDARRATRRHALAFVYVATDEGRAEASRATSAGTPPGNERDPDDTRPAAIAAAAQDVSRTVSQDFGRWGPCRFRVVLDSQIRASDPDPHGEADRARRRLHDLVLADESVIAVASSTPKPLAASGAFPTAGRGAL